MIKFKVPDIFKLGQMEVRHVTELTLHPLLVEEGTYLHGLTNFNKGIFEFTLNKDPISVASYISYLKGGNFYFDEEVSKFFQYMGYPNTQEYPLEYWKIKLQDMWIRNNFYKLELWKEESKEKYGLEIETGPYVGLEKVEYPFLRNIFKVLSEVYSFENYVLAGGSVIDLLMDKIPNDLDFFVTTKDEERGKEIIRELVCLKEGVDFVSVVKYKAKDHKLFFMRRTRHAITFGKRYFPNEQIILRLYYCPSEVVHGFDLDSCGVLYDGKNIWATKRTIYSLKEKINYFDPERMSETYAYRLAKYSLRGFEVWLPNFEDNVNKEKFLDLFIPETNRVICRNFFVDMDKIDNPLDIILFARFFHCIPKKRSSDYDKRDKKTYYRRYENYCVFAGKEFITLASISQDKISSCIQDLLCSELLKNKEISGYLKWNTQNPMEQLSGTFHPLKLKGIEEWYERSYLYG